MNKITFDEMLISNGLPTIGTIVTTPRGDEMEVVGYSYLGEPVVLMEYNGTGFDWTFDQIRLCTWEGKDETVSN